MKTIEGIDLDTVKSVYAGPEGDLWELIMGEQIHIGGLKSSMDLAARAGIEQGWRGIDLCCCNGAGMRFLIKFRGVAAMTGVDATPRVLERGRERSAALGLADRVAFLEADATRVPLPDGRADFVWGEDAWCYVADKRRLIAEAARLVKPGGTVAFTDWVEGPAGLAPEEAGRFLRFMKFPSLQDFAGYRGLLEGAGCRVTQAVDTGRFAPYVDLYLEMLDKQLAFDALALLGFDQGLMEAIGAEMRFLGDLARAGKVAQGLFVARRDKGGAR